MELQLPKQYNWTKKDQESVNRIYVKSYSYFKWFMYGLTTGVIISTIILLIDWWVVNNLIRGIL